MNLIISILIAFFLDMVLGDPYSFPHPVKYIGRFITFAEKQLRKIFKSDPQLKFAGLLLMISTVGLSFIFTYLLVRVFHSIGTAWGIVFEGIVIYTTFSVKCLKDEAMKIYKTIQEKDIDKSRKALSYIVGRDTASLDFRSIIRAVVETVAENTVDGFLSPLFYAAIGGAPLAMAYKAVNTLDSMVGYKNEKYMDLGYFSAKTDDAANFIPARLSIIFFALGALMLGDDYRSSIKIAVRDRKNHKSPNCAYAEGAVAGALGIKLGGTNVYFGEKVYKPEIGDQKMIINENHISSTCRIMYAASTSAVAITISLLLFIHH